MKNTKSRSDLIVVNKERARDVLGTLYGAYVGRSQLFRGVNREEHAPQRKFLPHGVVAGDAEHRRWLFFAAMTDRREVSDRVYESHTRLFTRFPELYQRGVVTMTPESIETRLRAEKVGSPGQSAQYWPRCAGTLFEMFDGEPLTLYKGGSIDALVRFKRGEVGDRLPGFGPKILSLLAMFYEELKLMQMPEDAFPVDVHVQRLMIATGVLGGTGRLVNEDAEKILRPLICTIALEEGWSALELAHAIWFLGNRLCTGCYRTAIPKTLCPTYDQCGGCPSTHLYFHKGLWDLDARRHRKGGDRTFALPEDASLFV